MNVISTTMSYFRERQTPLTRRISPVGRVGRAAVAAGRIDRAYPAEHRCADSKHLASAATLKS